MFNVENGTVEVTENSEGNYGTGSYVFIKDSNNNVKAVYFAAYRGDLNGDLSIDNKDVMYLKFANASKEGYLYEDGTTEESILMAAADLNGDHSISTIDTLFIKYQRDGKYNINQTDGTIIK